MLTKDHIFRIKRSVKRRGLGSFSLEEELIDFIACAVHEKMLDGDSFEEGYRQVIIELESQEIIPIHQSSKLIKDLNGYQMLQNYIKIAQRNFIKHSSNSFVNLVGLVLGLSSVLIITLYVQNEVSYDDYHPNADRLYRVNTIAYFMEEPIHFSGTSLMLHQAILDEIPQVETAVYKRTLSSSQPLKFDEKLFYDYRFNCVQKEFFEIFDIPVIEGGIDDFFESPYNVLLSTSFAVKIFDTVDPVGQIISTEKGGEIYNFKVVGVLADLPENTHFNSKWDGIDMISSMETYKSMYNYQLAWDINDMNDPTYLKLKPGTDEGEVVTQINEILKRKVGEELNYEHYLQPVQDIYLNARKSGIESEGDITQVYTFSLIGLLILGIACINYINLTTGKITVRTKEVGVRKVLGARKNQFLTQFIIEAFLLSFIALVVSLMAVSVLLPLANNSLDLGLRFVFFENWGLIFGLFGLLCVVSFISGGFPGLYLSKFTSINLLNSNITIRNRRFSLRKALVIFQFGISAAIIVCTIVIVNQLNFIRTMELGFDKESVVYIPLPHREMKEKADVIKEQFSKVPGVGSVSLTGSSLGSGHLMAQYTEIDGQEAPSFQLTLPVDHNFINTMGMKMQSGRWFDPQLTTDIDEGLVVNEAFVEQFGLQNPLGLKINRSGQQSVIIGVVKDFHFTALYNDISPVILHMTRDYSWNYTNLVVKLNKGAVDNTFTNLEEEWSAIFPDRPFEWEFLDAQLESMYRKEAIFGGIFKVFALIAITVSCLGLFGLVSFSVERKSREIGIRKVLGATISNILLLVSKEFSKLVLLGFLIAIPAAYYFLQGWLSGFKYRIDINYSYFALAGLITLVIAWLTMSYISFKAAKENPVDSLRAD